MSLTLRYLLIESHTLKEWEGEKEEKNHSNGNNSRIEVAELFRRSFTSLECEDKSSFWKGMWMKFKKDILSFTKYIGSIACFFSRHEIVITGLFPQSSKMRKGNDSSKGR